MNLSCILISLNNQHVYCTIGNLNKKIVTLSFFCFIKGGPTLLLTIKSIDLKLWTKCSFSLLSSLILLHIFEQKLIRQFFVKFHIYLAINRGQIIWSLGRARISKTRVNWDIIVPWQNPRLRIQS